MTKIQPSGHGVSMVEVKAEARLRRLVSRQQGLSGTAQAGKDFFIWARVLR